MELEAQTVENLLARCPERRTTLTPRHLLAILERAAAALCGLTAAEDGPSLAVDEGGLENAKRP